MADWEPVVRTLEQQMLAERRLHDGLLVRARGSEPPAAADQINRAIEGLPGCGKDGKPELTVTAVQTAMGTDYKGVQRLADRQNSDLVAPALVVQLPDAAYISSYWTRGPAGARAIKSRERHDGVYPARGMSDEIYVQREPPATRGQVIGWGVVRPTAMTARFVAESIAPDLRGTLDDPDHVEELIETKQIKERTGTAKPDEVAVEIVLDGHLRRIHELEEVVPLAVPSGSGPAGAPKHGSLPLVVDRMPYGFVRVGGELKAAALWAPGLERAALERLDGCRRLWAAFAFTIGGAATAQAEDDDGPNAHRNREWPPLERIVIPTMNLSGRGLHDALRRGTLEAQLEPVHGQRVQRLHDVVVHDQRVNLLLVVRHDSAREAWVISERLHFEHAKDIGRILWYHLNGGTTTDRRKVPPCRQTVTDGARQLRDTYKVLQPQATEREMRGFLRRLAIAAAAQRAADA